MLLFRLLARSAKGVEREFQAQPPRRSHAVHEGRIIVRLVERPHAAVAPVQHMIADVAHAGPCGSRHNRHNLSAQEPHVNQKVACPLFS